MEVEDHGDFVFGSHHALHGAVSLRRQLPEVRKSDRGAGAVRESDAIDLGRRRARRQASIIRETTL